MSVSLQMASSRSWHARFSVLTYLQIMVFYNLFTLLSLPVQVLHIRTLVMQLLLDEQLEVTTTLFTLTFTSVGEAPPRDASKFHRGKLVAKLDLFSGMSMATSRL